MRSEKNLRKTGTVSITDGRKKPTDPMKAARQPRSGPYVMDNRPQTSKTSHSGADKPDFSSEQQALEALRDNQKLIHLGRMAASIAHEVNNPLESISNLLYLIRMEPGLPETTISYLDLAEREMGRVVNISKQTLNFAREASEPVQVSLPEIVEEVLALYRHRIDEKQLRVLKHYADTQPMRMFPGEIRQVLANLVVNAIEACTVHGTLHLSVRPASASQTSPGLRITVADNGAGIPPSVRRHLGEPFFTTKGQKGTGLGLWVTRSIVEHHGGQLRLRTVHCSEARGESRHGTVFSLFLPFPGQESQSSGGESEEESRSASAGENTPRKGLALVPHRRGSGGNSRAVATRRAANHD